MLHTDALPYAALPLSKRAGARARWSVFAPPNLDGFTTVRKILGHELDWLRRRFTFVPPNLLGDSNLFTAMSNQAVVGVPS